MGVVSVENVDVKSKALHLTSQNSECLSMQASRYFPVWLNDKNSCWLDSALFMLLSSESITSTLKIDDREANSPLGNIISEYIRTQRMVNRMVFDSSNLPEMVKVTSVGERLLMPISFLEHHLKHMAKIRSSLREILMRANIGKEEFDSPVFAISALLKISPPIFRDRFNFKCFYSMICCHCGASWENSRESLILPIPSIDTLPSFSLEENCFSFPSLCSNINCGLPVMVKVELDKVKSYLLLQFPNGVPSATSLDLKIVETSQKVKKERSFFVHAIVQYLGNHFTTWVKKGNGKSFLFTWIFN